MTELPANRETTLYSDDLDAVRHEAFHAEREDRKPDFKPFPRIAVEAAGYKYPKAKASVDTEPVKVEPAKVEPAKVEPQAAPKRRAKRA